MLLARLAPLPTCTDPVPRPRRRRSPTPPPLLPVVTLIPTSKRYPARAGHDQFYGYGRVNVDQGGATRWCRADGDARRIESRPRSRSPRPTGTRRTIPAQATLDVDGAVSHARGTAYTLPGLRRARPLPEQRSTTAADPGDFKPVAVDSRATAPRHASRASTACSPTSTSPTCASRFPIDANDFTGASPGHRPRPDLGRAAEHGAVRLRRQGRRHRPQRRRARDDRRGPPRDVPASRPGHARRVSARSCPGYTDGESSPALRRPRRRQPQRADRRLERRLRPRLHLRPGERRRRPSFPAGRSVATCPASSRRTTPQPGYASGAVADDNGGAIIAAVAVGDADHDGIPEVYAADLEGKVYGWDPEGDRVFAAEANPAFSGKPLSAVRERPPGPAKPHPARLPRLAGARRPRPKRRRQARARSPPALDRHVYAWNDDGSPVPGLPGAGRRPRQGRRGRPADPRGHLRRRRVPTSSTRARSSTRRRSATSAGDAQPEIVVGTNEEYAVDKGTEGALQRLVHKSPALSLLAPVGLLDFANGRIYAIKPGGDPDGVARPERARSSPAGRAKIGIALSELLPLVGEGINGSPVIAPLSCSTAASAPRIGTIPAAGLGYLLNADGSSCLGEDSNGRYNTLADGDVRRRGGRRSTGRFCRLSACPPSANLGGIAARASSRRPPGSSARSTSPSTSTRPAARTTSPPGTRRRGQLRPASRARSTTSRSSRARRSATWSPTRPARRSSPEPPAWTSPRSARRAFEARRPGRSSRPTGRSRRR